MTEIEKVKKHLEDFVNDLIKSKKIFDAKCLSINTFYNTNRRDDSKEEELSTSYKANFNKITYKISLDINVSGGWDFCYLNTTEYDELYKCLMEIKFKIESEVQLKVLAEKFNKKMSNISVDELTFLESEFDEAVENEHYEKAEALKLKITELKKSNKKTKK